MSGFKSIASPLSIEVAPLTILAGANSTGKSSIIQPLLLLKQTLDATYDPGPLLLNGPNVRFTAMEQFLSRTPGRTVAPAFCVGCTSSGGSNGVLRYVRGADGGIELESVTISLDGRDHILSEKSTSAEIDEIRRIQNPEWSVSTFPSPASEFWRLRRERFTYIAHLISESKGTYTSYASFNIRSLPSDLLQGIIHLPGLRGNPERTYPVSAAGPHFPGTFERYCASVIAHWERKQQTEKVRELTEDLKSLGLSWKVSARPVNEAEVELRVSRLPMAARGGGHDLVSIADVGFGVSQSLPILAALHVATPGQTVYLEQPEIHLHPRAQLALAEVLARFARRGIQLIIETHSSLLLLALQSLVAEGRVSQDPVRLHWFQRGEDGTTAVHSAELDRSGAFGDWPEDFSLVSREAEGRYLDAVPPTDSEAHGPRPQWQAHRRRRGHRRLGARARRAW